VLRTGLLPAPFNTPSVPLDVGHSASIPEATPPRRHPAGPATSVSQCLLLCQFHHDICIHRWGWEIQLLPDGEVIARSPQGQVLRSHSPPPARVA
jgi:hypothetical protein